MKIRWVLLVIGLAFILLTGSVLAQEPTDDEVNAVAEHLNCPTCQGLNLSDCNTQTCVQWRDQIRDLLADGYSQQEVLDWYVARYGEQVLQEPRKRGIGLYVWLLPILGLLAGAIWLGVILKRWSTKKEVPATTTSPEVNENEADNYLRRVEQDLKNL
jgi:cytochrome c-type biogenesis protein CcmH